MTKEEAKKFGLQLLHGIMERNESYPVYANNVKQAIDALSQPSLPSQIDDNKCYRDGFIKGYEQAEKDLALTWEDLEMIDRIMADVVNERFDGPTTVEEDYKEVLRRFNKIKEEKQ